MLPLILNALQESAPAGPADPAASSPSPLGGLMLPVIIIAIFYFLLIRPQRKQQKAREAMLQNLEKGMRVMTTGGMLGKIIAIKDNELTLEVDKNVKIRFSRGAVAQVIEGQETPDLENNPAQQAPTSVK